MKSLALSMQSNCFGECCMDEIGMLQNQVTEDRRTCQVIAVVTGEENQALFDISCSSGETNAKAMRQTRKCYQIFCLPKTDPGKISSHVLSPRGSALTYRAIRNCELQEFNMCLQHSEARFQASKGQHREVLFLRPSLSTGSTGDPYGASKGQASEDSSRPRPEIPLVARRHAPNSDHEKCDEKDCACQRPKDNDQPAGGQHQALHLTPSFFGAIVA